MINRKKLVTRHNPVLHGISVESPLSVGNGDFAYTADITGAQSLYDHYAAAHFPLCTMSNWGWHTSPATDGKTYTHADLELTEYDYADRKIYYPVDKKAGNEEVYDWLRHNPHKFNLGRISLMYNGREIAPEDISDMEQTLHLWEGRLESNFTMDGHKINVNTVCHVDLDAVALNIENDLDGLEVIITFPYGHHDICGSDWNSPQRHSAIEVAPNTTKHEMDDIAYYVRRNGNAFTFDLKAEGVSPSYDDCLSSSRKSWEQYWNTVGIADFGASTDPRAIELERRMILSLYLLKIQSTGKLPPAETGLTVNSWYGRFHSEMYLWNCGFMALYNLPEKLLPSIEWWRSILPQARELATSQGFKGARWPKQPANDGISAPSFIAPLLCWQQPHIVYMLEMLYHQLDEASQQDFLQKHWEIVDEVTKFMVDFMHYETESDTYNLIAPLIPAQENHDPREVRNPIFEIEYYRFGLNIAAKWAMRLGKDATKLQEVADKIAKPVTKDGLYLAHENCPDTYKKFNQDHPMMSGAYGLIYSDRIDSAAMEASLHKVLECWEQETMWGWDFAMMAMSAARLGLPDLAMELLLWDSPKNQYVTSGNNFQRSRTDLPLYLPGNGSLLLALSLILAGYGDSNEKLGIPTDGTWDVKFENIAKFPY
ncbi:MAG: glycoside hydrolase family 65 [Defluviitaleaceae bacterium]|nr:glycoside hydrolase family 65 [Defluviitaleaceae bacterium]